MHAISSITHIALRAVQRLRLFAEEAHTDRAVRSLQLPLRRHRARARVATAGRQDAATTLEVYVARLHDVLLVEKSADDRLPKRIDCYQVTERGKDAAFKLDPERLVYSLRWKHNAHPPDFEPVLIQDEPAAG